MNKEGAISGMAAGLLFSIAYIVYFKFVNPAGNISDNWLFGISPEGIGLVGMCLNFIVAIIVCRMTAPVPQDVQEMVEAIRFPKGSGEALAH
jgi:cation/acetate symporter